MRYARPKFLYEDWEFNILGVYNYRKPGRLDNYFTFLIENHSYIPGDICEAGVYRGASLLATGLLLKELGSRKIVWGFDTFQGFPQYHANDELKTFGELRNENKIDKGLYEKVKLYTKYKSLHAKKKLTPANISTSGDFSQVSMNEIKRKIQFLGLNNVRLMKGPFSKTMNTENSKIPYFCAALLDCDYYESWKTSLFYIWEKLSLGGYVFLDEYYSLKFPGAKIAADEFFEDKKDKPQQHRHLDGDFERWFARKIFDHEANV